MADWGRFFSAIFLPYSHGFIFMSFQLLSSTLGVLCIYAIIEANRAKFNILTNINSKNLGYFNISC